MGSVLLEALIVATLGMALAFAANSWRSDGLEVSRDYFPQSMAVDQGQARAPQDEAPRAQGSAGKQPPTEIAGPSGNEGSQPEGATAEGQPGRGAADALAHHPEHGEAGAEIHAHVAERLASKGLSAVTHDEAEALWRDPMYQEYEATVFLDARRAEQYSEGHIPGAWHFDPFYPERTIDELLPLLASAMTIVVYCKGGECDDSESAALYLLNLGAADPSRLSIYVGGIDGWTAAQLPVERGLRGSGELSDAP